MNIPSFGFWFFDELVSDIGLTNPAIELTTPNYGNFLVKASGHRLQCLANNNKCVSCNLEGSLWILQAHHCKQGDNGWYILRENPHLNLYAINDSELVLMTQDHILPRSKGGETKLENLQTMCAPCNQLKANN